MDGRRPAGAVTGSCLPPCVRVVFEVEGSLVSDPEGKWGRAGVWPASLVANHSDSGDDRGAGKGATVTAPGWMCQWTGGGAAIMWELLVVKSC
jgi:hypothetical protein